MLLRSDLQFGCALVSWAAAGGLASSAAPLCSRCLPLAEFRACLWLVHGFDIAEWEDINTKLFHRFGIHSNFESIYFFRLFIFSS